MPKAVITTKDVDYTFDNQPCRLRRRIVQTIKGADNTRTIRVVTDRVRFVQEQVIVKEYEPVVDTNTGVITYKDPDTELRTVMKVLGEKDSPRERKLDPNQVDAVYGMVKGLVTLGNSFVEFEDALESASLLVLTRMDHPFNTAAVDWEVYEPTSPTNATQNNANPINGLKIPSNE